MNKKQEGIYEAWRKSDKFSLNDCYKHPSDAKLDAEFAIKRACISMRGKRFRILSYNTYSFTCAFAIQKEEKTLLIWRSPYNTEVFQIPEEWEEVY